MSPEREILELKRTVLQLQIEVLSYRARDVEAQIRALDAEPPDVNGA